MTENKEKPGPEPERVKIDQRWEEAVKKALEKKRPEDGWPKDDFSPGVKDNSSHDVKDEDNEK